MATSKLPNLGFKQVGQNLNVTITLEDDVKVLTLKGTKEELTPVKEMLKQYIAKKSPKLHKEIIAALTPKTTKETVEKEKKETKVKAEIKLNKNKAKALPKTKVVKEASIIDLALKIKEGKMSDKDKALLREALNEEQTKSQPRAQASSNRRPGEH